MFNIYTREQHSRVYLHHKNSIFKYIVLVMRSRHDVAHFPLKSQSCRHCLPAEASLVHRSFGVVGAQVGEERNEEKRRGNPESSHRNGASPRRPILLTSFY